MQRQANWSVLYFLWISCSKRWRRFPLEMLFAILVLSIFALIPTRSASAALITFTSAHLTDQTWRYDYQVTAQASDTVIEEFTIYFEAARFENLRLASAPSGWDSIVIDADVELSADGFFDAVALLGGLRPGSSQAGFSVVFDYVGSGSPGAQNFEIIDPVTFATVSRGLTSPRVTDPDPDPDPVPVPEPGALALWAIIIPMLWLSRMQRTSPTLGHLFTNSIF